MLPPSAPTDSDRNAPDFGVGVDTVAIMGPATEDLLEALHFRSSTRDSDGATGEASDTLRTGSEQVPAGHTTARVKAYRPRNGGPAQFRAELSLPRMLNGHNRNALDPRLLPDVLDIALSFLREWNSDVPPIDAVALQRLDLPRDYTGVESTTGTVSVLATRLMPRATLNSLHTNVGGKAQTATTGSRGRYMLRLYDKGTELDQAMRRERNDPEKRALLRDWSDATQGFLRCELELHGDVLRAEA